MGWASTETTILQRASGSEAISTFPLCRRRSRGRTLSVVEICRSLPPMRYLDDPRRMPVLPQENRVDPGARWSGEGVEYSIIRLICYLRRSSRLSSVVGPGACNMFVRSPPPDSNRPRVEIWIRDVLCYLWTSQQHRNKMIQFHE